MLKSKNVNLITEDGSIGAKGFVTKSLEQYFKTHNTDNIYVYCCGPMPMLKAVAELSKKYNIDGEANFEERMGCGIGACLGCAVKLKQEVKTVCKDGPVFKFSEII